MTDTRDEGRTLDDPKATYMNLRTCICGEDARKHYCAHGLEGEFFDPDWEKVEQRLALRAALNRETDNAP